MRFEIDVNKLILLLENGLAIKEISDLFGVNISTIKRRMKENGLKSKFKILKKEDVICLNCEKIFIALKGHNRKFCSSSCSTTFNNFKKNENDSKRYRKEKNIGICLNCKNDIIKSDSRTIAKYCSNKCQMIFQMNLRIESGKASTETIKKYLIINYGNKCMECGWCEFNKASGKVPIELEHIDGNSENNNLDNLKLLCPNCHSLTPTYKALNIGNGRHKRRERYKEGKSY
jgi:hypothetical protein